MCRHLYICFETIVVENDHQDTSSTDPLILVKRTYVDVNVNVNDTTQQIDYCSIDVISIIVHEQIHFVFALMDVNPWLDCDVDNDSHDAVVCKHCLDLDWYSNNDVQYRRAGLVVVRGLALVTPLIQEDGLFLLYFEETF
jgi:hypothetical protein